MPNHNSTAQVDILVIDDDEGMRFVLEKFLNHFFKVTSVSDGQEALLWLSMHRPRVIVTDLDMPNLNGIQFLKNINSSLLYNEIKVFIVTGHENPALMRECMEYGIIDYIVKPFNPLDLVVSIYKSLNIPVSSNKKLVRIINNS